MAQDSGGNMMQQIKATLSQLKTDVNKMHQREGLMRFALEKLKYQ